ncbi:MAG TPA: type II toxin-antitoxin system HicA family toxin [Bacteroidales bacterium]|nr:type II toxin-antitoxin system HicA family toxin [Bacteroidales bacterium]
MNLSPAYLIKILEINGFILSRSKGSHLLYRNPVTQKRVIVPYHGGKDLPKGTFYAILKQAGIKRTY